MSLLVLAAGQAGLVSSHQCDDDGFGKYRRARLIAAGRASSPSRGVLDLMPVLRSVGMTVPDGPDLRRRRTACLALLAHGRRALAVGQSALVLLGVQGLPQEIRPEVALLGGSSRASRAGIVVRGIRGDIPTVPRGPFRVAAPSWALAQSVGRLDRDHAVAVLDSAVNLGLVRQSQLAEVGELARNRPGARRVREWLSLVDGRAQSPLETWARLQCVDAGVPPDDLQVPIRGRNGRIVARGDLGWKLRRGRWLIAEIDGAGPHSDPEALYADRERQNAIAATGHAVLLRFTASDVARGRVATTVTAQLALEVLRADHGTTT